VCLCPGAASDIPRFLREREQIYSLHFIRGFVIVPASCRCQLTQHKKLCVFFNLLWKLESENSGELPVPASTTELLGINLITPIKMFLIF